MRSVRLIILCILLLPRAAAAQTSISRVEVGGDATAFSFIESPRIPGVMARVDVSVTPTLALETRVSRLSLPFNLGSAVQLNAGVRANLVRGRHVTLYGLVLPGVAHLFSPSSEAALPEGWYVLSTAPTHFVLDMGLGLRLRPTSRLTTRIEVNRDLHAERTVPDATLTPGGPQLITIIQQPILGSWNLHVGASYGFGSTVVSPRTVLASGRWTVGGQLGYTVSTDAVVNSAAGVFVSYRLSRWCDVDAGTSGFLRDTLPPTYYEGGRVIQAVGGVKLGVREGRFGVFFKARGGVNRDTRVINVNTGPGFHGVTMAVLDLGGVVDAYVSRRVMLRVDLGEALAFSRAPFESGPRGPRIYGLPMRLGVGWRF